ncbi:gliding motility-associated C-terminal domain-containing protein [Dyadobacter sp. CY345]|uniref:T9SS type B sorting domain-containing protein n=1 Tax=Dyadobacter sp. CY345 TaxID=2909335 RepID=UPI001F45069F|nr:gliding motility-associated C-terminal domain-containing protein [Dyadobacter sp. CY345]MCF2445923.1 gliding motility-associated C-terminal domain-containing protein [Dyadobacter sp. CY345]
MKRIILVMLIVSAFNFASAQGLCDIGGGGFELLPKSEGCAPLIVNISPTINALSVGYAQEYDGITDSPTLVRNAKQFTYRAAGTFTILQSANVGGTEVYQCKKIKVYENATPHTEYTSCGGGKIKVVMTRNSVLDAYDQVGIDWGDGSEEHIWSRGQALEIEHSYANTSGSPVLIVRGIYTSNTSCKEGYKWPLRISFQQPQLKNIQIKSVEMKGNGRLLVVYEGLSAISTDVMYSTDGNNYQIGGTKTSGGTQTSNFSLNASQAYQIKLASKDLCGGKLESESVSSMIVNGSSADEKNEITWNKYANATDFESYTLWRDGIELKTIDDINTTSFSDEDVQCGDSYEYYIVAKTKTITSTSAPFTIKTTLSSPKPIDQAFVNVVSDGLIEVTAIIPGPGTKTNYDLVIERSENGGIFKKVNTLYGEATYQDFDVKVNDFGYCYRLIYQNACGQRAPASEPICSILLKNESPLLTWTTEKPFLDEIDSYTLTRTGAAGSNDSRNVKLVSTFYPDLTKLSDLSFTFQIRADSKNGNYQSLSNIITYKRDTDIYAPDAFSPNDDGYNDTFEVKAAMFKTFKLSVINRWGEVVFHSNDIAKGWNGKIKGNPAPVGSYIWRIEIVNNLDQTVKKNGTFVLLK